MTGNSDERATRRSAPHAPPLWHTGAKTLAAAMKRCEHALQLLLEQRGAPLPEVDRLLADEPGCVLAHCLRCAVIVLADDAAERSAVVQSIEAIETAAQPNCPTRRHARAARAWVDGNSHLAAKRYGAIVADRPRDLIALMLAHAFDFRLSQREALRDRVARVLPKWDSAAPGYANVLTMYAFGLEENGEYQRAEQFARIALAISPRLPAAIHVIAHVLEMQGRASEGLAFLAETEDAWSEDTAFSTHLAWHRALFYLDAINPRAALKVYDAQIMDPGGRGMSLLADASALLWRLQLRSIHVAARWQTLAERWQTQELSGVRPFYTVHAMMAFAASGQEIAARRLLAGLPDRRAMAGAAPDELLAKPFCRALLAFAREDYDTCIECLLQVRDIADQCGGSIAQCDLIHLTLTEAALRGRRSELADALVAERAVQKPSSQLNQLLKQRLNSASNQAEPRLAMLDVA